METTHDLSDETLSDLKQLIEINVDSAKGYSQAAESIDEAPIAALFRQCASERRAHVDALRRFVPDYEPNGSITGTVHRWWLDLRSNLSSDDAYAVLAEAERGEDAIKKRYEDVLKSNPGTPLNDRLQRQYAEVKARHDQIRDMRDSRK